MVKLRERESERLSLNLEISHRSLAGLLACSLALSGSRTFLSGVLVFVFHRLLRRWYVRRRVLAKEARYQPVSIGNSSSIDARALFCIDVNFDFQFYFRSLFNIATSRDETRRRSNEF